MKKKKPYAIEKAVKRIARNVVGSPKPTTAMKSKKDKNKYKEVENESRDY